MKRCSTAEDVGPETPIRGGVHAGAAVSEGRKVSKSVENAVCRRRFLEAEPLSTGNEHFGCDRCCQMALRKGHTFLHTCQPLGQGLANTVHFQPFLFLPV